MDQKTTVANLYEIEQLGPNDVYIGRAGKGQSGYFGNPYRLSPYVTRENVILQYKEYFHERMLKDAYFKSEIEKLRGKRLVCFCAPKLCHGDVIAYYLNNGG